MGERRVSPFQDAYASRVEGSGRTFTLSPKLDEGVVGGEDKLELRIENICEDDAIEVVDSADAIEPAGGRKVVNDDVSDTVGMGGNPSSPANV
jgi:hypothetical protein